MCKAKKWLATLGAILIVLFSTALLWAGPPGEFDPHQPLDEHPWGNYGCGSTGATTPIQQPTYTYYQIRFSPTGGFYLIRVSFSGTKTTAVGVPKTVKPKQ